MPLIFEDYARDLAERVSAVNPGSVLEVACGTGVVTRELAKLLPQTCSILATDLNSAMVEHAQEIGTVRPVGWQAADVMDLPFAESSFDVVICQFSVMFFPDRIEAYRQIARVLRPGGIFLFNVWNGIEENEFAHVVTESLRSLFPKDPPMFLARTPHGYFSPDLIATDLQKAGFEDFKITQRDSVSSALSPEVPAIAYCQGTPLRNEILARDSSALEKATEMATEALRSRFGQESIDGKISGAIVEAS